MGMWKKGPNGKSVWDDLMADTPENQAQFGEGRGQWDGSQTQQGPAGPSGPSNKQMDNSNAPPPSTPNNGGGVIGVAPSGGQLSEADQRRQGIYGLRANENLGDWARRSFDQAAGDFGPAALNPNSFRNPMADSPAARFFQQRYSNTLPANALVALMLNGPAAGVDPTIALQEMMQNGMQSGALLGTPSNYRAQFSDINNMVNRAMSNDFSGMNDFQQGMSRKLLNDPYAALQMISGALAGTTGGFGLEEMTGALADEARAAFNDPMGNAANKVGPFLQRALQKLGWIS